MDKLSSVSQRMGQAMYAQAQQQPTAGAAGETAGEHTSPHTSAQDSQDDEQVVDAEIVDDDRDARGGAA